jgi:hypothetical protein
MNARAALSHWLIVAGVVAVGSQPLAASASITFQVSFLDPGAVYSSFYDRIRRNVISAGNEWASYFGTGVNATLQVQLSFADIATADSYSVASSYVGMRNGIATYEQGAAYEIQTGIDPNGAAPDVHIGLGRNGYLQNELWFDPSPTKQTAAVPTNKTDARSVFVHEFGHVFGFNGWRDGQTGMLAGAYQSTFDSLVTTGTSGGKPQLYFTGSHAQSLYGGLVPLTFGSYGHLGNAAPRPGANLAPDLMNGISFWRGTRYHVTPLDLAILSDTGFALSPDALGLMAAGLAPNAAAVPLAPAVPEPSVYLLMLGGLAGLAWVRKRAAHAA